MRLTGHHGDATATHVRVGEPCVAAVVLAQLVWEGLFRRDEWLHIRLPLSTVVGALFAVPTHA
jgi:hypothetical protein